MKKLNHDRWDCGALLHSEDLDRFLPEPWGRDHGSFQTQFTYRKDKLHQQKPAMIHFEKDNVDVMSFIQSQNDYCK